MAYYKLLLDLSSVETLAQFHDKLKATFGFSDLYEQNTRSLIQFLSNLRQPEEGMSTFTLAHLEDVLILEVKGLSEKSKGIIHDFVVAVEAVNYKAVHMKSNPIILLSLTEF